MRSINNTLKTRLKKAQQTLYNNADPNLILWISRHNTAIRNDTFLERTLITTKSGMDTSSIALRHMRRKREPDRVYVGYVANGTASVVYANTVSDIDDFKFYSYGFSESADDIAIAFDGIMPKDTRGNVEFITEQEPWIFWVSGGAVYGQHGTDESTRIPLSLENATKVTAVRAMWSEVGDFDFGLCLFFLLNGAIYYRQLINGEWTDAVPVPAAAMPSGASWVDIAAYRTWDYRICLQAKGATEGTVQELFTQYAGIAKQNTEHIEITDINAKGTMKAIKYHDTSETEHIEISNISASGQMIYGLSSVPVSVANIAVHDAETGEDNWGIKVQIALDYPITNVDGNEAAFSMVSTEGTTYTCQEVAVSDDGLIITITLTDFNGAKDIECTVNYDDSVGTILSPATELESFNYAFYPQNLTGDATVPQPIRAYNSNSEGTKVLVEFDNPLTSTAGNENAVTVSFKEYFSVPDGNLVDTTRTITETGFRTYFDDYITDGVLTLEEDNG